MNRENLIVGFTGDVMTGRTIDSVISGKGYAYVWGNVLPLLRDTDVSVEINIVE